MIGNSTTLVLGAGASVEYGYPAGWGLISRVLDVLRDAEKAALMEQAGVARNVTSDFENALRYAGQVSIDQFLEYRKDFSLAGRLAIALALQPCEKKLELVGGIERVHRWYDVLMDALNATPARFHENKLTVVTFNYDNSLEEYLFWALMYTHKLDKEATRKLLKGVPIIHVHGRIGSLHWEDEQFSRMYGVPFTVEQLRYAADSMRIIHDVVEHSDELTQARKAIQEAQRVVFLGLGYHALNMDRLGIGNFTAHKKCVGTGYGLGAEQRRVLMSNWPVAIDEDSKRGVLEYLREVVVLKPS